MSDDQELQEEELQQCQNCFEEFPADDPMITVFPDAYDFCSWQCVTEYATDQDERTHDEFVGVIAEFNQRLAAILAKGKDPS